MKIEPNSNSAGLYDDPELYSKRTIKIHPKYLFSLLGFGFGSLISFIIILAEEYNGDVSASLGHSKLHHLAIPLLFGMLGTLIGFIYGKKQHNKTEAFLELYVSQQTMGLILYNLPVLIAYLDSNLRYRYVNKTYEDWLGLSCDDVYGKPIKDIVSEKAFGLISLNITKATEGEIVSFESSRDLKGEERFENSIIIPHFGPDKKIKGFFTIVSDITKLKKRENKIRHQKDELAELNATKDKFFSIISHDLKSPFNSLLGFSELLFNDYEAYDEETRKKFIALIYESSQNIFKLLDNLLAWSRNQSGKIEFNPSPVHIKALIDENLMLLGQTAAIKNIQLQFDISNDYLIDTDYDLINTVMRNLLSNAIKFTPKDGRVTISANLVAGTRLNEYLEVVIADTGVGLAPENLENLFKIEKSHSTPGTNGESGTGLGLLLCKEFVEICNGKITAESELGKGSIFRVTLPNILETV